MGLRILRIIRKIAKYTSASFLMLAGILAIGIVSYNPINLISTYLPVTIDGTVVGLRTLTITTPWLSGHLNTFYNDPYIWGGTIAGSVLVLIASLFTFSSNPRQLPRTILNSPVTMYRKLKVGRDKLINLVTHLNEESAKWRTAFNVFKSPYSLLRAAGLSPQMALGLLVTTSTVGSGVIVNETILAEKSFSAGDSGIYAASVDGIGADLDIPTTYSDEYNTLRVDLGITPVKEITISDISVGTAFTNSALPNGQTTALQISGNPNAENFNPTRLQIGEFIFEKNRCKTLTLSDIKAHTLIVEGNASDGQSLAPSPGSARMRAVLGGHFTADKMETKGGLYDRVWIQAPSSGVNGQIGKLTVSNIVTKGGSCVLSKMDIGTMTVRLNTIGNGDGFAVKDFTIETSVEAANLQMNDNVEVSISEPATIG